MYRYLSLQWVMRVDCMDPLHWSANDLTMRHRSCLIIGGWLVDRLLDLSVACAMYFRDVSIKAASFEPWRPLIVVSYSTVVQSVVSGLDYCGHPLGMHCTWFEQVGNGG